MTIAAGIIHNDGILLCSDTQIEFGAIKTHGPKMGWFDCPGGRIAFAIAGATAFALFAIQKCKRHVADIPPPEVSSEVERILSEEYRRVVFDHPSYSSDPVRISYWFLLSLWSYAEGTVRLLATHENTSHEVTGHECIGIGQELAQYIMGPALNQERTEQEAMLLASHMLEKVKNHVPGCGGASRFLAMQNDGSIKDVDPFRFTELARRSYLFDVSARRLLHAMTDDKLTDPEFEECLDAFNGVARGMRRDWKAYSKEDQVLKAMLATGLHWNL